MVQRNSLGISVRGKTHFYSTVWYISNTPSFIFSSIHNNITNTSVYMYIRIQYYVNLQMFTTSYFTILIRMYKCILSFPCCYAFWLRLYMQTTSNIYADKHQSIPYIMHNHIYISAFYAWWIKWSFKYKSGWSLYLSMYSWIDRHMRSNNTLVINQIWMIWKSDLYGPYHCTMCKPYIQLAQSYICGIRVYITWSIQLYPSKNRITIYLCIPILRGKW